MGDERSKDHKEWSDKKDDIASEVSDELNALDERGAGESVFITGELRPIDIGVTPAVTAKTITATTIGTQLSR